MNLQACVKWGVSFGVACVTAVAALVLPAAATAAPLPTLSVNGQTLGSTALQSGAYIVMVNAPVGVSVKFRMDGRYLGEDKAAPYSWPIVLGAGNHKLDARWEGGAVESQFTVLAAVSSLPAPVVPAPVPAAVAPDPVDPIPTTPVVGAATSGATLVHVSTSAQLIAALKSAAPGQMIALADGSYVGKFEATASGSQAAPITLIGSRAAVLSSGAVSSGYGLHITGSNWRVTGISVTNSSKGIVLDGSKHTTISSVDVGNVGAEAVHFRSNSSDSVIENSVVHDTGLRQPGYGEGIYIGSANSNWGSIMGSQLIADRSDRVVVRNNRISNTSAEGIDVKEGTTGGSITGNVFSNAGYSGQNFADSWVDIKGNGYTVAANSGARTLLDAFQVRSVLSGWGRGNTFTGNSVLGGVPGYEVWVQSVSLGNVVVCKASGATKGLSNIRCSL